MKNAVLIFLFTFFCFGQVRSQSDCPVYYADGDGDGYGNPDTTIESCTGTPAGYVANASDCDDTLASVKPGAVEIGYNVRDDDCDGLIDEGFPPKTTYISPAICGTELPEINTYIYAGIVSGATAYNWKVTTMTGPDAGQVQYLNTVLRCMRISNLPIFSYDTSYKIEVAPWYAGYIQPYSSETCIVTTPPAFSRLGQCPTGIPQMNTIIYARMISNATAYRFRVVDPEDPANYQILTRVTRDFRMNQIIDFVVHYNKVYNVDVAFRNPDGTWSEYGDVCEVITPSFPTTMVSESQCSDEDGGPYEPASVHEPIWADYFHGALQYVFKVKGPGLPANGIEVPTVTRWFKLAQIPSLIPGETYNVCVRLVFNHNSPNGPFGKVCTIRVPGSPRLAHPTDIKIYPNPFVDAFSISGHFDDAEITISDMSGRTLEKTFVASSEIANKTFGNTLPSGTYIIGINSNDVHHASVVMKQ